MSPPVIFVIDDDAGVLHALRDDLSRHCSIKRVASAVGDGATVIRLAQEYLTADDADAVSLTPGG